MIEYVWLVPLFPLLGVIINGLLGIRFPKKLIGLIGSGAILLSFLVSCSMFLELIQLSPESRVVQVILYKWIPCGDLQVNIGFLVDALSLIMMLTVSGVSFVIHVYSMGYMHDDPGFRRYFTYLNLFVFFMLILVSANSFLLMFIGWEGVGLCSYLLIGFWYQNKAPADAGKKAFIVNRVGDYG
ncbi:MAG: NADH-quinone oxidoreductase subunit L, partial [Deltaproteobacteria bacterium]|nr:NADH-quinone oxidoreductase subunit L [Deltaproteobacteria bacterium]